MTYLTGESSVVHDWTQINFAKYVYNGVRFGVTDGNSVIINGSTIQKVLGVVVSVIVDEDTTFLGSTGDGVYFLGNPKTKFTRSITGGELEYDSKYSMYFRQNDEQWINCGNDPSLINIVGSVTVSIWANPDDDHPPGQDGYMMDTYSTGTGRKGFVILLDMASPPPGPPGRWAFMIGRGNGIEERIDGGSNVSATTWTNLTGVWNDTTKDLKIYVNGIEDGSINLGVGNLTPATSQIFRIGAGSGNANEFNGFLNNGAVWDAALTDEEVLRVFNEGKPIDLVKNGPQENSLVSWWKVGDDAHWDGTDWHIPDQKGSNGGISDIGSSGGAVPMDWDSRRLNAP